MITGKIRVEQTKGLSGRPPRVRATIAALGLGKIGKFKIFDVNPAIYGMLKRVRHLIEVTKVE